VHLSAAQSAMLAISLASVFVQAATLRILVKRKLRSDFPIFFRYTAYCVGIGLLGFVTYAVACECWQYYYLFWACNALLMCFQFGVMYETFVNALKPYSALIDLGKMIFRWAGIFLLLAALLTGFATNGSEGNRILAAENLMERSLGLMQSGLLLLFFAFERRLGLSWRSYSMAIAIGLGASAATTLSTSYFSARYPSLQPGLSLVTNIVFLAVVTFWAVCLRQAEPARKNVMDSPSRLIFQRWNEALQSTPLAQDKRAAMASVESFLPGIEKTVDRVMARKAVS
jgi:hypothetical protein